MPLFSIVIPTKNRPHLLRDAILSVLLQDFQDFELIVSDNFNDWQTKEVVDEFTSDSRLRYFRTDKELNIPDHWEFATSRVAGDYVLVLSDRSLLRYCTLVKLYQLIQQYYHQDVSIYTWQHNFFENKIGFLRAMARKTGAVKLYSGRELLKEFAREQRGEWKFPVCINACYKAGLAEQIRHNHGRLFNPINPDTFGGFFLLSYAKNVVCIGEPLFMMQAADDSTGMLRDRHGPESYLKSLNVVNPYRNVPIKAPFTHNLVFDDYLTVRVAVEACRDFQDVSWSTYFQRCYEEFTYFDKTGFIGQSRDTYLREWRKALNSFDEEVQNDVKNKIKWAKVPVSLKATLATSPFLPFLRKIQNRLQYGYQNKRYATALEAAGFDEELISRFIRRIDESHGKH